MSELIALLCINHLRIKYFLFSRAICLLNSHSNLRFHFELQFFFSLHSNGRLLRIHRPPISQFPSSKCNNEIEEICISFEKLSVPSKIAHLQLMWNYWSWKMPCGFLSTAFSISDNNWLPTRIGLDVIVFSMGCFSYSTIEMNSLFGCLTVGCIRFYSTLRRALSRLQSHKHALIAHLLIHYFVNIFDLKAKRTKPISFWWRTKRKHTCDAHGELYLINTQATATTALISSLSRKCIFLIQLDLHYNLI